MPHAADRVDLPRPSGYVKRSLNAIHAGNLWMEGASMLQPAKAYTEHGSSTLGLNELAVPSSTAVDSNVADDRLHAGLYSILVQWSHGKTTFDWLRHCGAQHVEIHVRDGSDEDERALIFSIVPLPNGRPMQEFRVSTEGRGLVGQIQAPDNRALRFLRGPRELWSWNDLRAFIEQQSALIPRRK